MNFGCFFIVHPSSYKREEIVDKASKCQGYCSHQYQMEVSNNPITVMGYKVKRQSGINYPTGARGKEQHYTTYSKHHGSCKFDPSTPHCGYPVEDMHSRCWNSCQSADHKYSLFCKAHSCGKHMMSPGRESYGS